MNFRLGVDGGGSKTEVILVDATGAVRARQVGPGTNPSVVGQERAGTLLRETMARVLATPPDPGGSETIGVTLLCMAGARSFWQEFAAGLTGFGRVVAVDDSLPILELATGGGPGLVLHAGTGSFVAAREPAAPAEAAGGPFGPVHYAGGLGWRCGDAGSGYDLGRRALGRALLELQGWLPRSGVSAYLTTQTGLTTAPDLSRHFYAEEAAHARLASLAPGLLALAEQDAVARELVATSVLDLLDLAHRVAAKLFGDQSLATVPAALSGPILNHPVAAAVLRRATPMALVTISDPPAEGVRRLVTRL